MRAVLAAPTAILTLKEGVHPRFDAAAFETVWREAASHAEGIEITPWSPQTELDAAILKVKIAPPHKRISSAPPLRVLITGGVHGNEPVGVVTALDIINAFKHAPDLIGRAVELTVLPALNFEGLSADRRRLSNGHDLNRQFDPSYDREDKVAQIEKAIGAAHFDLSLDLHGANERERFFVIKQTPDGGLANEAIEVLEPGLRLLSDAGETTGGVGVYGASGYEPNRYTLEAAGISTSSNVGTVKSYMTSRGTPYGYTLESPGNSPLAKARAKNLALALAMIRRAALR
jgi:hypothetical protein